MKTEYQNLDIRVDDYHIVSDKWSIWIEKDEKPKKTPNTKHDVITRRVSGYHTDFFRLFRSFVDKQVRESNARTVDGAIRKITAARRDALKMIKAVLEEAGLK